MTVTSDVLGWFLSSAIYEKHLTMKKPWLRDSFSLSVQKPMKNSALVSYFDDDKDLVM